jgi:hypothetical protein
MPARTIPYAVTISSALVLGHGSRNFYVSDYTSRLGLFGLIISVLLYIYSILYRHRDLDSIPKQTSLLPISITHITSFHTPHYTYT